jgi:hypothetical protein
MFKTKILQALKDAAPDISDDAAHHITDAVIEIIIRALIDAVVKLGDRDDRQATA